MSTDLRIVRPETRQITITISEAEEALRLLERAHERMVRLADLLERLHLEPSASLLRGIVVPVLAAKLWIASLITQPDTQQGEQP